MAISVPKIKGAGGVLSVYATSAYKPVICLTESSHELVQNTIDTVTMCSDGNTEQTPISITETVNISGIVVDTTASGGSSPGETVDELKGRAKAQVTSGLPDTFRIARGTSGFLYFKAFLTNVSDTYPAEGYATFSATLQIQGNSSSVDPNAGGGGGT